MNVPRSHVACATCGSVEWVLIADEQSTTTYSLDTVRRIFAETDREMDGLDAVAWRCMACDARPSDDVEQLLYDEFMGPDTGDDWQLIHEDEWVTHPGLDEVTEKRPDLLEYEGEHDDCGVTSPHVHGE